MRVPGAWRISAGGVPVAPPPTGAARRAEIARIRASLPLAAGEGPRWVVILVMLLVMNGVLVGRRFSMEFRLVFWLINGLIFVTFISILVILRAITHMTSLNIFVYILAFMLIGWALLLIAHVIKHFIETVGLWGSVKARGYEILMGLLLFTLITFLAWFPFAFECTRNKE
ncbi:callose synthase 3-like [Triticum aestivum]|uniref:callose synthase 3-like n=1 Tax=Triticum aestivum TaxID=4565 RepID=UPI001D0051FC|nr:callose synthase 3-like [Triticum aestivum]